LPLNERDYYKDKSEGSQQPRGSSSGNWSGCLVFVIVAIIVWIVLGARDCDVQDDTTTISPPTTPAPSPEPAPSPPLPEPAPVPTPSVKELKVHFIDVGQGDSILVDLGETEVLIDGGDREPGIVSYLKEHVDGPLEVMVATHPHADHIGGLIEVLETFDVEEIWHNGDTSTSKTYEDFMNCVDSEGAEVHIARLHNIIKASALSFYVHHPADLEGTQNNNSIVLHLGFGETDFLFTGDVEQEAEGAMMMLSSVRLPEVEILKVGHHGSRTASSEDFIAITKPAVAIYMAGKDNRYGHPHIEAIETLRTIGAEIYGTDNYGTIVVSTEGKTYTLRSEKNSIPDTIRTSSSPESTSQLAPEPIPPSEETATPAVQLPTEIVEISEPNVLITRDYKWIYQGEWSWTGEIPLFLYEYYQKIPRPPTKNYSVYVTHPLDDPYIDLLVEKIKKAAQQEGYTEFQNVEFAAAFVQSLPYTADSVTTPFDEYPRYPIETLVDNGGDCEDTSILLASIIDKLGYGTVLIMLPNHVGVGVKGGENIYGSYYEYKGNKYYYIETTGEGWKIGKLPDAYKGTKATIRPLVSVPVLTHEGRIEGSGFFAKVEITVRNVGTAPAYNVTVLAGFDAGNGMVWNSKESEPATIGVDQKLTVTLYLKIPLDKHTRLVVQIGMDNVLVEESYSDWFDT